MMKNPIAVRMRTARNRSFGKAILLLAFNGLLILLFMLFVVIYRDSSPSETYSAETYYLFFAGLLFTVTWLTVPGLTAGLLTEEIESRRLEILMTSRLTNGRLIGGKIAGAMSEIVLLLVSTIPVLAAATAQGGLSPSRAAGLYLLIAAEALVQTCVSLMTGAFCRRTTPAVAVAYLLNGVVGIGTFVLALVPEGARGSDLMTLSPFGDLLWLLQQQTGRTDLAETLFAGSSAGFPAGPDSWFPVLSALVKGGLALLALWAAWLRLERYEK